MAFVPFSLQEAEEAWKKATRQGAKETWTTLFGSVDLLDNASTRPMALGYLKYRTFIKWMCTTAYGLKVLGIDCSCPGRNPLRETRLRRVFSEAFAAIKSMIRKIKLEKRQKRYHDYDTVAAARSFKETDFVLFKEFAQFLMSQERIQMCERFRRDEVPHGASKHTLHTPH